MATRYTEYHDRALKVQQQWIEKAKALRIPLSATGHAVSQQGPYTGIAVDTFLGRFSMLPVKLASMHSARDQLAAATHTTPGPRLASRVRGKALHYGCAIPFVAIAAPSLSQLMHNREAGTGPVTVPSLEEVRELDFDCDRETLVSERARRALEFMRLAMEEYGAYGQPTWPAVPSSLHGAFLAGEDLGMRILVIPFDASVHGWAAVIQTSPSVPGRVPVGGYRQAMPCFVSATLTQPRSRIAPPHRYTGRRSPASWRRGRRVSCSDCQSIPYSFGATASERSLPFGRARSARRRCRTSLSCTTAC